MKKKPGSSNGVKTGHSITLKRLWREERYSILLASIFIYTILSVLLPDKTWSKLLIDAIFLILVVSIVFESARIRSVFSLLGILGILAILGHVASYLWSGSHQHQGRFLLAVSSMLFITAAILRISKRVLGSKVVTGDTIRGAIIIYLLIGTLFTSIYLLIEILLPGSLLVTHSATAPKSLSVSAISRNVGYFSMVTLTTLGYGDIIPINEVSRTAAWLEAVIGQIYLAVIIARLVGVYIAQSSRSRQD